MLYELHVGNVGTVYRGTDETAAWKAYREYVAASQRDFGRAAGEPVVLFQDGEPVAEYDGAEELGE